MVRSHLQGAPAASRQLHLADVDIMRDGLRAREARARAVRGAGGSAGGTVGRGSPGHGGAAVGAVRGRGRGLARRLRALGARLLPARARRGHHPAISAGTLLASVPKGRDAADLRDAYDGAGQPMRIGEMGFSLRPGFVARVLGRDDGA